MKKFDYKKLIEIREERGYSQVDVAYFNEVVLATVKNWEEDETTPDANMIGKLASYFKVSTDYFYIEVKE